MVDPSESSLRHFDPTSRGMGGPGLYYFYEAAGRCYRKAKVHPTFHLETKSLASLLPNPLGFLRGTAPSPTSLL